METSETRGWLSRSYFARHWRGELSLPVSYFINGILGTIAATAIIFAISEIISERYAPWPGFLAFVAIWGIVLLVTLWQLVGIWRSASNHPGRGGHSFWAGVAKIMVIIGALQTGYVFTRNGWPQLRESFSIAAGDPTVGTFTLKLTNEGTEIEYAGGIPFGAADELARMLKAAPQVKMIRFNSNGGRIAAAEKLKALIQEHDLDTYVADQCLSACTVAYLGGRERYLDPNGRLGFHASSFSGVSETDLRPENLQVAHQAVALGVERGFAEKAYLSPSDSMWFPTAQELVEARFVTRITRFQSRASVEETMLTGPTTAIYEVIRQQAPEEFEKLLDGMLEITNTSTSNTQAFERGATLTATLRRKYAAYAFKAPDDLIRASINANLDGARMFETDLENCNKYLIYGPVGLPPEVLQPHTVSFAIQSAMLFSAILEGARTGGIQKVATDEDWALVGEVWAASGRSDQDLASVSAPDIDDPNLCRSMISLLEAVLSAEGPAAERVRATFLAEAAAN